MNLQILPSKPKASEEAWGSGLRLDRPLSPVADSIHQPKMMTEDTTQDSHSSKIKRFHYPHSIQEDIKTHQPIIAKNKNNKEKNSPNIL